jgi:hypothetical protein
MKRLLLILLLGGAAFAYYKREEVGALLDRSAATAEAPEDAGPTRKPSFGVLADVPVCSAAEKQSGCLRVLFIGNSYTYYNRMPEMLSQLAASANRKLIAGMVTYPAWTLRDHVKSDSTLSAIRTSRWDYVVIQEQSQIPANVAQRETQMFPAAVQLAAIAQLAGAKPVLYLTWPRQNGWPENGMPDPASMQTELNRGYVQLSTRLVGARIAPVGPAWVNVVRENPGIGLWDSDGSHPKAAGSYLAANVFYATIYGLSPRGLKYVPNFVTPAEASVIQDAATNAVLSPARTWESP